MMSFSAKAEESTLFDVQTNPIDDVDAVDGIDGVDNVDGLVGFDSVDGLDAEKRLFLD